MLDIKNLEIDEVQAWKNDKLNRQILLFKWGANIGFGELVIYNDGEGWKADTETLCNNADKDFIKLVFDKFIDMIDVKY